MTTMSRSAEMIVGLIVFILTVLLVYNFTTKYFEDRISLSEHYNQYNAKFSDIDGLSVGSDVKIGGIVIGKILESKLDPISYHVDIKFTILDKYKIPEDSMVSVSTSGIMGGKYLKILIGNSNDIIKDGGEIEITQSSIGLENLINLFKK